MLEGLETIDWSKVDHAYGPATDLPDLLRQLGSREAEMRQWAMGELYGTIWHQGTVYEASAQAVPFLVELIQSENVQGKDEILVLLAHLARGSSYHDVHQHLPLLKEKAKKTEWQAQVRKELVWVEDVKSAVLAGEESYLKLLEASDPALRDAAAYLLAFLNGATPGRAARVWHALDQEQNEMVQSSLLLAFGILAEPVESNISPLLQILVEARSKSLRVAAAMALARIAPPRLPEACTFLLEDVRSTDDCSALCETIWAKTNDMERLFENGLDFLPRTKNET